MDLSSATIIDAPTESRAMLLPPGALSSPLSASRPASCPAPRGFSALLALRAVLRPNAGKTPPPVPMHFLDFISGNGQPGAALGNRSRSILSRMALKTFRGTATSAIWKVTYRA